MADSYNRVILMGRLTRDPQAGTLPSGTAVCELGLAANRRWRDRDGVVREDVLFIDCTAYGKVAETLAAHLTKGRPVHVEGHLKLDRWEQAGQTRTKVRVIVEQFRFVDPPPGSRADSGRERAPDGRPADAAGQRAGPAQQPGKGRRRPAPKRPPVAAPAAASGDDDVPF
jgi:single-strand DNA-binding protein